MSVIEIKNHILEKLFLIEDINFLNEINDFIDSKTNPSVYVLNDKQKLRVSDAKAEYLNGIAIDNETIVEEAELWLNSK